jgi:hypothetical protein
MPSGSNHHADPQMMPYLLNPGFGTNKIKALRVYLQSLYLLLMRNVFLSPMNIHHPPRILLKYSR